MIIEKKDKVKFNEAWFITSIRVVVERFHNNFKVRSSSKLHGIWFMNHLYTIEKY
jgi:hypothetical protein